MRTRWRGIYGACHGRGDTSGLLCLPGSLGAMRSSALRGLTFGSSTLKLRVAPWPLHKRAVCVVAGSVHRRLGRTCAQPQQLNFQQCGNGGQTRQRPHTPPGRVDLEQRLAVGVLQLGGLLVQPLLQGSGVAVHRLRTAQPLIRGQHLSTAKEARRQPQ